MKYTKKSKTFPRRDNLFFTNRVCAQAAAIIFKREALHSMRCILLVAVFNKTKKSKRYPRHRQGPRRRSNGDPRAGRPFGSGSLERAPFPSRCYPPANAAPTPGQKSLTQVCAPLINTRIPHFQRDSWKHNGEKSVGVLLQKR